MKKVKRIVSLLLAAIMVVAMSMTVLAAPTAGDKTITINNSKTGHTYKAYQIFQGRLESSEGKMILSDIDWGEGVDGTNLLTATTSATGDLAGKFTGCTTAAAIAEKLETDTDITTDSKYMDAFAAIVAEHLKEDKAYTSTYADNKYTISNVQPGYYFIKDNNKVTGYDASTKYMVKVTTDAEITPKSSFPTLKKKVKENVKYKETTYGEGYNDIADYNMGDDVPFKLIGTLPETLSDYTSYTYTFHDKLPTGLTLNADIKVMIYANKQDTTGKDATEAFEKNTINEDGCSFELVCNNVKNISGISVTKDSIIEVTYTATLNTNATVGGDGNINEAWVTYSNNPNTSGEYGETTHDKVIVFTYALNVTKVDNQTEPAALTGAEFKLKNEAGKWAVLNADGKVTGWEDEEKDGSALKADDNVHKIIGLDAGTYYTKETKAPTGYNLPKNEFKLTVTADTDNKQNWNETTADAWKTDGSGLKITVTGDEAAAGTMDYKADGHVKVTVKNSKGATLPETGGIGTTIFYVIGIILVAGAGLILVTKRRMRNQ